MAGVHRYRGYRIERGADGKSWIVHGDAEDLPDVGGSFGSIPKARAAIDGVLPRHTARIPDAQRKRPRLGKVANTTISEEAAAVLEEVKTRGHGELAQWIEKAILEKADREKRKRRR